MMINIMLYKLKDQLEDQAIYQVSKNCSVDLFGKLISVMHELNDKLFFEFETKLHKQLLFQFTGD